MNSTTAAGGLIDLRYQVLDPDKANSLHAQQTPPALVDERTGLVVNQLLMNHAVHKGQLKVGVTDGTFTEVVSGELKEGDQVITEMIGGTEKSGSMSSL